MTIFTHKAFYSKRRGEKKKKLIINFCHLFLSTWYHLMMNNKWLQWQLQFQEHI